MDITTDPAPLPRLPLTQDEITSAGPGYQRLRDHCVRFGLAGDHLMLPDAGEIRWPFSTEVRWLVWRDALGVWLDEIDRPELDRPALHGPMATLNDALHAAADAYDAERQAAIDAIPEALMPPLGDLLGR